MIFSEQEVYCQGCGKKFKTNFQKFGGRVCSMECSQELGWKRTLSILGKEYYPDPKKK